MIDDIFYRVEDLFEDIEESIAEDRQYFLGRKGELVDILQRLIERIEDE